jgi:hypothetical protein
MVRNKSKECWISKYNFDIEKANQILQILKFDSPDDKWLDFVCSNRIGAYTGQQYDLVIGPVANDDVFPTIRLYEAGFLSREQAIEAVKVRNLFDQCVFLTEKAISMLVFQGANNG